jgi:hypothetical protein
MKLGQMSILFPQESFKKSILLLFSLLCAASMWLYWGRIPQNLDASSPSIAQRRYPLTDLYAQWFGAQEVLLRHRDPYSDDTTHKLQVAYYGEEIDPSHALLLTHQQRFAYPLYVTFLLAPTVRLEFRTVQKIFWVLLLLVTIASVPLWARAIHVKLSPTYLAATLTLTLASIPVLQGLQLLQLGLLVAALLAAAAAAAISGRLLLAGTLLAIATIKPQMTILPIAWFILWASSDWRQRRGLLGGFLSALTCLVVSSEFLLPGWLLRYPRALRAYADYTGSTSLLGVLIPTSFNSLLSVVAFFIAATYCWRVRRQPANSFAFAIATGFVLTLTVSIVPTVLPPFNHVLLLPVFLLVTARWNDLWRTNPFTRFACILLCICGFLPWFIAFILFLLPASLRQSRIVWSAPLSASLTLPIVAFSFLIALRRLPDSAILNRQQ